MFLSINLNMIKLIASLCKYNYIFKSDIIIIITPELQSPPPNCTTTHVGFVQINPTCKRLLSTDIPKKTPKKHKCQSTVTYMFSLCEGQIFISVKVIVSPKAV